MKSMVRTLGLGVFPLLVATGLVAQQTGTVTGAVTNAVNDAPLSGAQVGIDGTNRGFPDQRGWSLRHPEPPGRHLHGAGAVAGLCRRRAIRDGHRGRHGGAGLRTHSAGDRGRGGRGHRARHRARTARPHLLGPEGERGGPGTDSRSQPGTGAAGPVRGRSGRSVERSDQGLPRPSRSVDSRHSRVRASRCSSSTAYPSASTWTGK